MAKYPNKTNKRDPEKSFLVKKVAEMYKRCPRYIYYILNGERENDEIFKTYMDLKEGQNSLLKEVKKLVPFN